MMTLTMTMVTWTTLRMLLSLSLSLASHITLQVSGHTENSPGQVIYVFLFISISPCTSILPSLFFYYAVSLFSMEFCMFYESYCCCGKVVATCNTCKWAMLFICHCVCVWVCEGFTGAAKSWQFIRHLVGKLAPCK